MKIHKAGRRVILTCISISLLLLMPILVFSNAIITDKLPSSWEVTISIIMLIAAIMLVFFYRKPNRQEHINENYILLPADGKIVVCEKVFENYYLKKECFQVSVFMSALNVHVNWIPANGTVVFKEHIAGKNYPAYNPKSSNLNERCSTVIKLDNGNEIMITQIAGIMARRIVNNLKCGQVVKQGEELGVIKLGSRVDIHLPADMKVEVSMHQKVKGLITTLAKL